MDVAPAGTSNGRVITLMLFFSSGKLMSDSSSTASTAQHEAPSIFVAHGTTMLFRS